MGDVEERPEFNHPPAPEEPEPKTQNDFLFSFGTIGGEGIISPILPVIITTKQQAYRTAALLKIMADLLPEEEPASTCEEIEQAIRNT